MRERRVSGQAGTLALTALLLLVLWGCSPPPAPEKETPAPVEPPSEPTPEDDNRALLDEFVALERSAATGRVIVRVLSPGGGKQNLDPCSREIKVQTWNPTIFWKPDQSPREVTWQLVQSPFGSWMEGDRIHFERKQGYDPCFAEEPFEILYPDLDVESGEALQTCQKELPQYAVWAYKAKLFNANCEGEVAIWDPVVIIKPQG